MGRLDVETRKYMSKPEVFADAFNYYLYGGKQIVKPEELQDVDSAELAVVYGSGARVPVQRFRDTLKRWTVKRDKNAVYMLLGAESQICSPHKGREPRGFERFKSSLCELTLPCELRHGGEKYALRCAELQRAGGEREPLLAQGEQGQKTADSEAQDDFG